MTISRQWDLILGWIKNGFCRVKHGNAKLTEP